MPLTISGTPDVTEALPFALTEGGQEALKTFEADPRYDVSLNGIGYLLRATAESPYQRAGEQVSKQQIDSSQEAGEQTLGSWWLRSQVSWHLGAGLTWYEPGAERETQYRFTKSQGVDVWTPGEISLLRDASFASQGLDPSVTVSTCRRDGVDGYVVASGTRLYWRTPDDGIVLQATLPAAAASQPAVQGTAIWAGHATGVSRWSLEGGGTLTTPLTTTAPARVWWVKQRLFIAVGPTLYSAPPNATGAVATVGTALYTHPDPTWVWVDVSETPDAVLGAGYAESESAVLAFSLETQQDDPLPVLGAARQVAKMPPGEQVRCMGAYLGSYFVLGTTKGVRVGEVGSNGQVAYGPVTVPTTNPVVDVTFADRFAYCSVTRELPDGTSGAVRIDLSAPIGDTQTFAWAWDVSAKTTGDATAVCMVGNTERVVVAAGGAISQQHADKLVPVGWLETGRIRYATAELKTFRFARVSALVNAGTLQVSAITPEGNEENVVTYDETTGVDGEAGISVRNRPRLPYLSFRIALTPGPAKSPVVTGLTIKALPAVRKARLFGFPLSCFDYETDRYGNALGGYPGSALHRVVECEALEDEAAPITVHDLRTGEGFLALIERVEFAGTSSPDGSTPNFGGRLDLTLRRL